MLPNVPSPLMTDQSVACLKWTGLQHKGQGDSEWVLCEYDIVKEGVFPWIELKDMFLECFWSARFGQHAHE